MPQRNSQNPVKSVKEFAHGSNKFNSGLPANKKSGKNAGVCPKCGAEVPPKPGFRLSSLKCPKCGTPMSKT